MNAGIQLSSFRALLQTPQGMDDVFARCAQMGCQTVQLQWLGRDIAPARVARALRDAGLCSVSVQDLYAAVAGDLPYYLDLCAATGSRWLCVSRMPEEIRDAAGVAAFAGTLDALTDRLAPLGLELCFHPTAPDYRPIDGVPAVEALCRAVAQPLPLCVDFYHAHLAGVPLDGLLTRYGGQVCMVHFKDCTRGPDGQIVLAPAGQGEIDFVPALAACRAAGVPYGFVEQETFTRDPFACIGEAFAWLRQQ